MPKNKIPKCSLVFPPLGHICGLECLKDGKTLHKQPTTFASAASKGVVFSTETPPSATSTASSVPNAGESKGLKKGCFSRESEQRRNLATDLLNSLLADEYYKTSRDERLSSIEFILDVFDKGTLEHDQASFLKEEEDRNFPSNDEMDGLMAFAGF